MCFIPTVVGGPTVFSATSASMYATERPIRSANAAVARASVDFPASRPPRNTTVCAWRAARSTSCSCSFMDGPPVAGGPVASRGARGGPLDGFGVPLAQVLVDVVLTESVAAADPKGLQLALLDQPVDGHPRNT